MAEFLPAIEGVLVREGGLVDDPNDAGGLTNMGISWRTYKSVFPHAVIEDLRHLTVDQAKAVYNQLFWNMTRLRELNSQQIANSLLDAAVNLGIAEMVKIAQRACNAVKGQPDWLVVDGVMGQKTVDAINDYSFVILRVAIRSERCAVYKLIVAKNPSQEKFLQGWLNRAHSV